MGWDETSDTRGLSVGGVIDINFMLKMPHFFNLMPFFFYLPVRLNLPVVVRRYRQVVGLG